VGTYTSKVVALKVAAWALVGLFLPAMAWAAGLGKLTVLSALGQPLRAEIEISSVQPGEAESLAVRLASFEDYRQAGVERSIAAGSIRFAVDRRSSGQHVVVLSSLEPINEPFLDLLVDLSWDGGHLVREYTFLLDPPGYKAPAPAVPVSPMAPSAPGTTEAPAEPAAVPSTPAPAVSPPIIERPMEPVVKPAVTYKMQRGDTLTKVALEHSQEGVSLQRMLVALYRANQEAFDANNMNRIQAGKILKIPDRETIEAVSQSDAQGVIAKQESEFDEYRRQIGMAVAQGPAREAGGRQVSGRIGAPTTEKEAPPRQPAKDQLRLSKAGEVKTGGDRGAAARADDLAAKEKALKEANERIAMLEKNVRDLEKLVELKSEAGAKLQQAAKGAPAKAAPAPAAKAAPTPPKPAAPAATKPADTGKAEEAPKTAEAPKAAPKPAPKPKPRVVRKPAPPPPPPPEPSFMDEMLGDPVALGAGGGVVVLLALYAGYAWRKKKKAQAESGSIDTVAAVEAPTVFGAAATAEQIDADSATLQGDLSQGTIGRQDTEEIDPIAEADVYMAYGRDAQAEEILKEALGKEPGRHEIRAKLLEIYANRKDLKAFGATATELSAATGGQGPIWEKALALGLSIDPQNPLYGGAAGDASGGGAAAMTQAELAGAAAAEPAADEAAQAAPPLDFDLDLGAEAPAAPKAGAEPPAAAEEAPSGLDFDLGADEGAAETKVAATPPAEAPAEEGMSIDFDLGAPTEAAEPPKAPEPAAADGGLSMDFDLGAPAAAAEPAPEPAKDGGLAMDFDLGAPASTEPAQEKAPALDLSSIDLNLDASPAAPAPGEGATDAHWQEVATKLDLAKAYEEMGDKDGARELLNEVLAEGDGAQQQQAKTMLAALG